MKKILMSLMAITMLLFSCENDKDENGLIDTSSLSGEYTGTYSYALSGSLDFIKNELQETKVQKSAPLKVAVYSVQATVTNNGEVSLTTTEFLDTTLKGTISESGEVSLSNETISITGTINAALLGNLTVNKGENSADLVLTKKQQVLLER